MNTKNETANETAKAGGAVNSFDESPSAGAGAGVMLPAIRGERGDIGAGGGRGVLRRGGKVSSTRGGASVRSTERQRLAVDSGARAAAARDAGVMVGAVLVGWAGFDALPVRAALVGAYPAGGLLCEVQGQNDLAICAAMSRKLLASMRRDGKTPSSTTGEDSTAAGCLALARWRAINAKFPARRVRGSLASVAWRAIVRESSRDLLGDAVHLGDLDPASLAASVVPLPCFSGDDSRDDKAARLAFERSRAQRPAKLAARLDSLAAAANGRRVEVVAKVGHAAALLLGGASIDSAATSAGFKARGAGRATGGAVRAGDALGQAVRRLGFAFQFNLRQGAAAAAGLSSLVKVVSPRGFQVWQPVEHGGGVTVAAMAAGWSARPSAGLPLQRGKLAGHEVKRVARLDHDKRRAANIQGKRSARAAAVKRAMLTTKRNERRARASAKLRGELLGAFLPAVELDGASVRNARLLAAWRGKVWGAV